MTYPFRQPRLQLGPLRPDIPLAIDETHPLAKHLVAFVIMDGTRAVDLVSGTTADATSTYSSSGYGSNGAVGLKYLSGSTGSINAFIPIKALNTFTIIECSEINGGTARGGMGCLSASVATGRVTFLSHLAVRFDFNGGGSWSPFPAPTLGTRLVRAATAQDGVPVHALVNGEVVATYSGSSSILDLVEFHVHGRNSMYDGGTVQEAGILFDKVLTASEHREIAANVYVLTRPAIPMPVFTAAAATPNFDIPTTSYAVSLPTPTLTSQTAFSVPVTSYAETLPAPSFTTATAIDVPVTSYTATLPAPSFTTVTAFDVPAISYAETLPAPSFTTNTALDIPAISYTTTLPAPSFTTAIVHSIPVVSYTVTLHAITVSSVSTEAMQIMAGDWAVRTSAADWAVRSNEADWAVRIEAGDWKYDA